MTYWQKLKSLFRVRDLIFTLLLFFIIIGLALCKSSSLVEVTFSDEAVDIVSSAYTMNIPYDMVESIELIKIDEDDEIVNGVADIAMRTGVWRNEVWGEYHACVDLQTANCIAVHLDDGRVFVFSRRNAEETAADFATFQSYLAQ